MVVNAEGARGKLFTRVSRARVEARALLGALKKLEEAAKPAAEGTQHSSLAQSALRDSVTTWYAALATADLHGRATEFAEILEGGGDLHNYAEGAWGAANGLSRLLDRWPEKKKPAGDGELDRAAIALTAEESTAILNEVIFECCKVTIPDEVEEKLAQIRVGKALDFHAVFDETLADPAQRGEILSLLKHRHIGGWVDPATGLIYRVSRGRAGRVATCIAPFVAALLTGTALYGFSSLSLADNWDYLADGWQLVGAYGLVLAGATFHLLIEALKQNQTKSAPILAAGDLVYWLNLRWVGLLMTIAWVVIVTIGLRAAGVEEDGELSVYFFAGYSLDSVAGLILTRFNSSAEAAQMALTAQLAPAAPGGAGDPKPAGSPA
jgi:hypothetical protein